MPRAWLRPFDLPRTSGVDARAGVGTATLKRPAPDAEVAASGRGRRDRTEREIVAAIEVEAG